MLYEWFNELRLGDCFWHCLFMRKLAQRQPQDLFRLYCNKSHYDQLKEVVSDLPTVTILPLENKTKSARNCWIGEWAYSHPLYNDIVAFLIEWFKFLASEAGLQPVFEKRWDLLAGYPSLQNGDSKATDGIFLVVNSYPQSGQWGFEKPEMERFVRRLAAKHPVVTTEKIAGIACTTDQRFSITSIGRFSQHVSAIIGGATGPIWPTFNIWNRRAFSERIIFSRDARVDYGEPLPHFNLISDCEKYLESKGVL